MPRRSQGWNTTWNRRQRRDEGGLDSFLGCACWFLVAVRFGTSHDDHHVLRRAEYTSSTSCAACCKLHDAPSYASSRRHRVLMAVRGKQPAMMAQGSWPVAVSWRHLLLHPVPSCPAPSRGPVLRGHLINVSVKVPRPVLRASPRNSQRSGELFSVSLISHLVLRGKEGQVRTRY